MNWNQMINDVMFVVITVILPILVKHIIDYMEELKKQNKENSLTEEALGIIEDAVIKTNQVYVSEMKSKGMFNAGKQREAFNMAKNTAILLLNNEIKDFLESKYKDFDAWLNMQIEKYVNEHKEA